MQEMKLKEKIDNAIWDSSNSEVVSKLETIAEDFAVGFGEYLDSLTDEDIGKLSIKQL